MKIEIKSKSPAFKKFVEQVDKILSKTQHLTIDGGQMDASDNHFEEQSRRLQRVGLEFDNGHPPHIINSFIATDLIILFSSLHMYLPYCCGGRLD